MLFTIQFKEPKSREWKDNDNYQPSSDRNSLALEVQKLAKAYPTVAFRVLSPKKAKS